MSNSPQRLYISWSNHPRCLESHVNVARFGYPAVAFAGALAIALTRPPAWWFIGALTLWVIITSLGAEAIRRSAARVCDRAMARDGMQCPQCAFDLSGMKPEGQCPECGRPYSAEHLRLLWAETQRWLADLKQFRRRRWRQPRVREDRTTTR